MCKIVVSLIADLQAMVEIMPLPLQYVHIFFSKSSSPRHGMALRTVQGQDVDLMVD
jgi:hypothetical protein